MDDLSCKLDKSSSRVRLEIDIAQIGEHGVGGSAVPLLCPVRVGRYVLCRPPLACF